MKKLLLIALSIFTIIPLAKAQVPQGFNFQSVIRDASGVIVTNQPLVLEVTISTRINGNDSIEYIEYHTDTTSQYGVISLQAGRGTAEFGSFSNIDWSSGNKYISTRVDIGSNGSFVSLGESELLSVPYALHAGNSSTGDAVWSQNFQSVYVEDERVGIGTSEPEKPLHIETTSFGTSNRILLLLSNKSNDDGSATRFDITAGTNNNKSFLGFSTFAKSYDALAGYSGYSSIFAARESNGLIIRSDNTDGNIQFSVGGSNIANVKASIDSEGTLKMLKSDVYIEEIGKGVIMKSPNGSCWRVTPDNNGTLTSELVNCPE